MDSDSHGASGCTGSFGALLAGTGSAEGNPLEIELTDGTVLTAWGRARGGKYHPIPREDVLEKFRKVTVRQLTPAFQAEIIALCDRLETVADASTLLDPLADRAP